MKTIWRKKLSTKEDLQKEIETLQKIPDNQIKTPKNIPVGVYIQEAENLYQWCQQDKDALIAYPGNWSLIFPFAAGL